MIHRLTVLRRAVALPWVQARHASTLFRMPAMSPTMTEGGIASWKLAPGDTFSAGDVLLEIETDKATIDVEAQDDGVMGKILVGDGEKGVQVGRVIAVLAEEGDDLSKIEVPSDVAPEGEASAAPEKKEEPVKAEPKAEAKTKAKSETKSEPKSEEKHHKITHTHPLFPSVSRLLADSNLSPAEIMKLKGTGRKGMLTKGDVLFALGKIKVARGSAGKLEAAAVEVKKTEVKKESKPAEKPMDAHAWRRAILAGLEKATKPVLPLSSPTSPITAFETPAHEFDELLEPYASLFQAPAQPRVELPSVDLLVQEKQEAHQARVAKDEWEGLF